MNFNTQLKCLITAAILTAFFMVTGASAQNDDSFKKGLEAYKSQKYKSSIKLFKKAIGDGCKKPTCYFYLAASYQGAGYKDQAIKLYQQLSASYKGKPVGQHAKAALQKLAPDKTETKTQEKPKAGKEKLPGLKGKIEIVSPKFGHKPVSKASINALYEAIDNLPPDLHKKLVDYGAKICIAPNLIDKWPHDAKTLPEGNPAPTLAELPGRIYGKTMTIYERSKYRRTTKLKAARSPSEIKHTCLNMCIQLLDEMMIISQNPGFRKNYEKEKKRVPLTYRKTLATFLKNNDWGPRETCAEMGAALLGGGDEFTQPLFRCFPETKAWLKEKLSI